MHLQIYAYDYESITHSAGQRIQTETQIPFFWYFLLLYAEEEGAAPHEHDGQFPQMLLLTTSSLGENGGRFAHILSNLTSRAPKSKPPTHLKMFTTFISSKRFVQFTNNQNTPTLTAKATLDFWSFDL